VYRATVSTVCIAKSRLADIVAGGKDVAEEEMQKASCMCLMVISEAKACAERGERARILCSDAHQSLFLSV
jgi:hypothetical protein